MEIKLEKLKYEISNLSTVSKDVHVDFDYDDVESNKIRMKLKSYVGIDEDKNFRFSLDTQFLFSELPDDVDIKDCINELVQNKNLTLLILFF